MSVSPLFAPDQNSVSDSITPTALSEENQSIPGAGLSIVFIFGGLLYSGVMKIISRKIRVLLSISRFLSTLSF